MNPGQARLLAATLLLALVVVGASSFLRLAGNGLGCEPWPRCYGTEAAAQRANDSAVVQGMRLSHRVAATLFLVVASVLVWKGWRRWPVAHRSAGVLLLAVTLLLAGIGLITPSPWPWVTWINLLGGFTLVALLLLLAAPHDSPWRVSRWFGVLLVLLVLQALAGATISVRLAGAACANGCATAIGGDWLALFNPVRAGSAIEVARNPSGSTLHALHRLGGLLLAIAAIVAGAAGGHRMRNVALAAGAVLGFGFWLLEGGGPAVGAAHALAAALLIGLAARMAFGATRTNSTGDSR
jgi:cytochrome c oxidase assembly protein subunit 15